MRLLLLTALTMVAFAANSVLNRMAIFGQGMDPLDFAAIRLGADYLVIGRPVTQAPDPLAALAAINASIAGVAGAAE